MTTLTCGIKEIDTNCRHERAVQDERCPDCLEVVYEVLVPLPITRDKAFTAFLATVVECVPPDTPDWLARRCKLREAATIYCGAAVEETIDRFASTLQHNLVT